MLQYVNMNALRKALRDRRCLIFFDLEGTQFSHEVIEIGAYSVLLHEDLTVKRVHKPFNCYVKAKNHVGKVVTDLTGITDDKLKKEGLLFPEAISRFHQYMAKYEKKCVFVAFGNQDIKIIENSVYLNGDAGKNFARLIKQNYFDFSAFISNYIKDENGNALSLKNYLKLFKVIFEGQAHDASSDAYNLIELYKAFLREKDLVRNEYEKTLIRARRLPAPIAMMMNRLQEGLTITPADFDRAVEESLK